MDDAQHDRFLRLWTEHQPVLVAYVSALMGDAATVDDLVQEVAIAAWRQIGEYDSQRPFLAWILGIARNQARSVWRARRRAPQPLPDDVGDLLAATAEENAAQASGRLAALRRCLGTLPATSAGLLRSIYGEGQDQAATAATLGLSHGALRVRLTRLRSALRTCIDRRLAGGDGGMADV